MRTLLPHFPLNEDPLSGRRWRWRLPLSRVLFALILLLTGFILCVYGLATFSVAPGAAGLLCFLPGAYATFNYASIMRGRIPADPETYLAMEEVADGEE